MPAMIVALGMGYPAFISYRCAKRFSPRAQMSNHSVTLNDPLMFHSTKSSV